MARRSKRGFSDVGRYTGQSSRPPSFQDEPEDDSVTSGTTFFLVSLVVFLAIVFAAVHYGTNNIEDNLVARSSAALVAAGFNEVAVEADGATVRLSGSITTEQNESAAFEAVKALAGVHAVEGRLWPVFSGELEEIVVTGDAIEISWKGASVVISGNVASEERRQFVVDTLDQSFSSVDIDNLSVLEGLEEESGWLGATLGLLIAIQPSLSEGAVTVDPDGKLLIVSGEVLEKDLRNALNAKVSDVADQLAFAVIPAIRVLQIGPTQEEIEELQVNLDELIEGKVVEFETKSFELTAKGIELLDVILDALKQAPDVRIEIAGHTDSRGSAEANLKLSNDRANSVFAYLVANGESPERFDMIGYGQTTPTASNDTTEGRAKNRRIEFTALEGES